MSRAGRESGSWTAARPGAWGLAIAVLLGCGESEPQRAAVRGTVTYKGQPVADGSITFFPTGAAKGKPAGAPIVGGSYQIAAEEGPLVGPARVEIQAFRKTGRQVPDLRGDVSQPNRPLIDEKINVLPPQFNLESQLSETIAAGDNTIDFAL